MNEHILDLRKLMFFLRRKAWLLGLGVVLGAGLGLLITRIVSPIYQATTQIMITRAGRTQTSDFTTYLSDLQLTQTYAQWLGTQTILDLVSDRLGFKVNADDVDIHAVQDTQIIVVSVKNQDPGQAARIANEFIKTLTEQNELVLSSHYDSMETSLRSQKSQIEAEIQKLQQQIQQTGVRSQEEQKAWLESQLSTLREQENSLQLEILQIGTPITLENRLLLIEKNSQLDQLHSLISLYQSNYNDLLAVYGKPDQDFSNARNSQITLLSTTQALYQQYYVSTLSELESVHLARLQNTPTIVPLEVATPAERPVFPTPWLNLLLGVVLGFVFMLGIVLFREEMDDTLRTPEAVVRTLDVPVLACVPELHKHGRDSEDYVSDQPDSPVTQAFHSLHAGIEFASAQSPIHTVLVTSPESAEGKTMVAVNLAANLSQLGKCVTLIDGNLRHPSIHRVLGISNELGTGDLCSSAADMQSITKSIQSLPRLTVVPGGNLHCDPIEVLDSPKMNAFLNRLKESAEMIIVDSPSSLIADTQILAGKVDAVLLVIQPGVTHAESAKSAVDMFTRAGTRVVGVVLNRIPSDHKYYYGEHRYLYPSQAGISRN